MALVELLLFGGDVHDDCHSAHDIDNFMSVFIIIKVVDCVALIKALKSWNKVKFDRHTWRSFLDKTFIVLGCAMRNNLLKLGLGTIYSYKAIDQLILLLFRTDREINFTLKSRMNIIYALKIRIRWIGKISYAI